MAKKKKKKKIGGYFKPVITKPTTIGDGILWTL